MKHNYWQGPALMNWFISWCRVCFCLVATAHLSLKLTRRQESSCQTAAATWLSAEQRVHVSTTKMCMNKYIHVCAVCLSLRAPLYLARRIPQKVTEPVECEVTPSVIDRLSYFMGTLRACQWALSQFSSLTRDHLEALAPPLLGERMEQSKRKWAPERKVTDFIDLLQKEAVATWPNETPFLMHTQARTKKLHINLMTAAFYQDSVAQTDWTKIKWLMSWPIPFHFAVIAVPDITTCPGCRFNFWTMC